MMKIIGILKHGTEVKKGDSVIQLDPTDIKKYIIERESRLETQLAVLEKLHVDQQNRIQDLDSRLKNETASYNLKKLELESSQFETPKNRKIKELEFEQAKLSLNKVKQLIRLNKTIEEKTLLIERIRMEQLQNEIKNAYDLLPALTIRTPISGIFQVAENRRTKEMVKIGDEIFVGNNLGNVPDLTWMKVNTAVNETDYFKLKTGQKVIVRLDAMPALTFEGEVSYLGKLCQPKNNNSRQKVFEVEVRISESDERLKPGMTVSCEFLEE
jgi:multidrug resistance efflux pump